MQLLGSKIPGAKALAPETPKIDIPAREFFEPPRHWPKGTKFGGFGEQIASPSVRSSSRVAACCLGFRV